MRSVTTQLLNLLNSSTEFLMADLYTFTLASGTILRYTSADIDITWGGQTWSHAGPMITRGKTRTVVGVEVDTLDLTIYADATTSLNGLPFLEAVWRGVLDGAALTLTRIFMSDWNTAVGVITLFSGNISDIEAFRTSAKIKVKSLLEKLNIQMPKNVYQAGCVHTLYDSGCALNKATFTVNGVVGLQNADGSINTNLTQADSYFDLGSVTFLTGANTGVVRTVKSYLHTNGKITFIYPLPATALVSDTFTISPGCDKVRTGDCTTKFNNTIRFKGFEFIPVPETAS